MNTGQTLLTIGAIVLLSFVILRVNNNFLLTSTVLTETQTGVLAVSLATSRMEKANSLAFDESTADTTTVTLPNQLTRLIDLGPDNGEVSDSLFDDFDDYNGFITVDSLANGVYKTICQVDYVDATTPDIISNQRTWHKRIIVRVTSPSFIRDWETMEQDTISLTSIFSYWFFF